MNRTSTTHPLRIDAIPVANGHVGLTLAPGKCGTSEFGPDWSRDLRVDLQVIRDWENAAVITLMTGAEMEALRIPHLGVEIEAAGIEWRHLPIEDGRAPDAGWWQAWRAVSPEMHHLLERGGRVLIHCRGGLERAAMVAALLMMERGLPIMEAYARIAAARPGAQPLPIQTAALIRKLPPLYPRARQIAAMLRGGAPGDAMGAEIEFWPLARIRDRFPDGIDRLMPHQGRTGVVTDDTQMTLFTLEGLIRAVVRGYSKGICHTPGVVHHALLRWYATQGGVTRKPVCDKGLITDPRLHVRRAPGMTCTSALAEADRWGQPARNGSKGCGTIMRVAPLAFWPEHEARKLAVEVSALTHGHPTGPEAAACFAGILRAVAEGASVEDAARGALALTSGETAAALRAALDAPRDGVAETAETLGSGWVAEEALAIAVYAALCARDLDHGLQIALVHSGDSDSTGAIAGNLLGLMFPEQVMAHPLQVGVECSDLIERLARDFVRMNDLAHGELEGFFEVYPGW